MKFCEAIQTTGEEPPGKIFWKTVSSVIPSFRSFRRQEERHSSLALVGLYINGLNLLLLSDNTKLTPLWQRMLLLLLCCCSISSLFFPSLSSLVKIWVLIHLHFTFSFLTFACFARYRFLCYLHFSRISSFHFFPLALFFSILTGILIDEFNVFHLTTMFIPFGYKQTLNGYLNMFQ